MALHEMNFNFSTMQWIVMAVLGVYSWLVSRQSASAKELLDLRLRVVQIEEHIKHMPSKEQLENLNGDMKAMRIEIRSMREVSQSLNNQLNLMNQYLMREKP